MKRTNDDTTKRIALELSLKSFGRNDGRSYEACAQHVITAWRPLLEAATEVSFMLWVADGSDILEWRNRSNGRATSVFATTSEMSTTVRTTRPAAIRSPISKTRVRCAMLI